MTREKDLAHRMSVKTECELREMLLRPDDWTQEALDAATNELFLRSSGQRPAQPLRLGDSRLTVTPTASRRPNVSNTTILKHLFGRIFSVLAVITGVWLLYDDHSFSSAMETTEAIVTSQSNNIRTGRNKFRKTKYRVEYSFSVAGRIFEGSGSASSSSSSRGHPQYVTVYYNKSRPSDNRVTVPELWKDWVLTFVGLGGGLVYFRPFRFLKDSSH